MDRRSQRRSLGCTLRGVAQSAPNGRPTHVSWRRALCLSLTLVACTALSTWGLVSTASRVSRATLNSASRCRYLAQPATMPYPSNGKLYAIGDPHSDPESTLLSLRAAGLASPRWEWTGGRSVLIVIGDVADRGESSFALFRKLRALRRSAARAGGRVVRLVGNHELMLMNRNYRYVQPADAEAFGGFENLRGAWSKGGELAEEARCFSIAAQVGGDVFVHAGLLAAHLVRPGGSVTAVGGGGLDDLNKRGREAFSFALNDKDPSLASMTSHRRRARILNFKRLMGDQGPMWTRLLSRGDDAYGPTCTLLEEALAAVGNGAKRIVVGHTVQEGGAITTKCNGKLLLIDTGISSYYGSHASALEISRAGVATAIYPRDAAAATAAVSVGGGRGDRQRAVRAEGGSFIDGEFVLPSSKVELGGVRRVVVGNRTAAREISAELFEWISGNALSEREARKAAFRAKTAKRKEVRKRGTVK